MVFFFSSRRRHTRCGRDWSSDVCSSDLPRAGKSLVSVNLAHLLAAADGRVLLVDGDLRRGVLHRYFGVEAEPGLADVVGGASVLDAVRTTDTPNLDLLPVGRIPA